MHSFITNKATIAIKKRKEEIEMLTFHHRKGKKY